MAYYYRVFHPDYSFPPPFSPQCPPESRENQLFLLYPLSGQSIRLENASSGVESSNSFIAKAIHANPTARVFWYSNGKLIQTTIGTHEIILTPHVGLNNLSIHDEESNEVQIQYKIIKGEM
jgi:penicillin-binding protein 1C